MKAFVRVQVWMESEDGSRILMDWRGREFDMSFARDAVSSASFGPMVEYVPTPRPTLTLTVRKDPWKFRRGVPEGWGR